MSLKDFQTTIGANPDGDFGKETMLKTMAYYKLSKFQVAHFYAQVAHETGVFKTFSENLNYSEDRMLLIFKSDFDINKDRVLSVQEKAKAKELKGSPEKIANFVYANQNGNGPESSGDGWKYRGRGALQLTGRANYQKFADFIKDQSIMDNPDLVATKYAFESAIYFFTKNKLWATCNKGVTDSVILAVTKRINGGTNGLEHRKELTLKYYNMIKDAN